MTLSEFARQLGVSHVAVSKGIAAGRLPEDLVRRDARGRTVEILDPERAEVEWRKSTTQLHPEHAGSDGATDWRDARTRRELAQAGLAELELAERSAQLVRAADVEARLVGVFGRIRTKLLGVPARFRQADPAQTPASIALLEEMQREALTEIADGATESSPDAPS